MRHHHRSDVARSQTMRRRVAVIDAHAATRRGLRAVMAESGTLDVCGESDTMAGGLALLASDTPDVVIVDLSLPDDTEMSIVRAIREQHPGIRILVFCAYEERFFAARMLQAGADGYLMKDAPLSVLLEALATLVRGRRYVSPPMEDLLLSSAYGRTAGSMADRGAPLTRHLTVRQQQVLQLLGEGCTPPQIAWRLRMSVKTVETHCAHIKERAGLRTARDLLCYAVSACRMPPSRPRGRATGGSGDEPGAGHGPTRA